MWGSIWCYFGHSWVSDTHAALNVLACLQRPVATPIRRQVQKCVKKGLRSWLSWWRAGWASTGPWIQIETCTCENPGTWLTLVTPGQTIALSTLRIVQMSLLSSCPGEWWQRAGQKAGKTSPLGHGKELHSSTSGLTDSIFVLAVRV